jgi:RimJ/RimL family protein N-acetyltransferase
VSTLFAILPDVERRAAAVRQWDVRPDFASVNVSEPGAAELCTVLREAGVSIEAGLSSPDEAECYLALKLGASCVRVLLEPEEPDGAAALATVAAIESVLDGAGDRASRLLHGEGVTAWLLIDAAFRSGYDTRIGLEDVLTLPDGALAPDNAALVRAAFNRLSASVVSLRDVASEDLAILYAHQQDPQAAQLAGFPSRGWEAFHAHWARVLADSANVTRTVLAGGQVAGTIACFPQDGEHLVGYWLGREFWGRGVATTALRIFLDSLPLRPLTAYVARHNLASRRVLEKCGFVLEREDEEELMLRLPKA